MLLIRGAVASGAVSSSWMWKRLTSVLTVISWVTAVSRGLYFTFSWLLTPRKCTGMFRTLPSPIRRSRSHGCETPVTCPPHGRQPDQCQGGDGVLRAERRPLRPPLVHRSARSAEELLDQRRRARGRIRRRHGLRRILDQRLQPDRGVRHDRHARSGEHPADPLAGGGEEPDGADVLRHPGAGWRSV